MDVITSLPINDPTLRGGVLAIGNFDGVHRGHQAVIARAKLLAERLRGVSGDAGTPWGVLTFEPHPRTYFQPQAPHFQLTPPPLKAAAIAATGADLYVQVAFNEALSLLSPDAFINDVLIDGAGIAGVIIGHDFHFGHRRLGTPQMVCAAGEARGFASEIVPAVADETGVFASSAVRRALSQGDTATARRLLGYGWRVRGTVVSGAGRGTGLGYPTANIAMETGQTVRQGIYAARVHTHDGVHDAATYYGTRPTYDNGRPLLETFLFDFDRSLYGETIDVEFVEFLRPDAAFVSSQALITQMDLDVAAARKALAQETAFRDAASLSIAPPAAP